MQLFRYAAFSASFPLAVIGSCLPAGPTSGECLIGGLRSMLSHDASISQNRSSVLRWSDFHAPTPGAIVNVATEDDVSATVSSCIHAAVVDQC